MDNMLRQWECYEKLKLYGNIYGLDLNRNVPDTDSVRNIPEPMSLSFQLPGATRALNMFLADRLAPNEEKCTAPSNRPGVSNKNNSPALGIIRAQEVKGQAYSEAIRLALRQVISHNICNNTKPSELKKTQRFLFIAPWNDRSSSCISWHFVFTHHDLIYPEITILRQGYREIWASLLKDLAYKLRLLTKNRTKVEDSGDILGNADRRLEAIEKIEFLTSPCKPIPRTCFIADLDRVFYPPVQKGIDPEKLEGKQKRKLERIRQEEKVHQDKVGRLVKALERLFVENGGQVVFFVEADFPELEGLVHDQENIVTVFNSSK